MRILVVNNYYPEHFGGIEITAKNLVNNYRQAEHQVRWIACDVPTHPHVPHPDDVPLAASNFAEEKLGFPYPIPRAGTLRTIINQVKWCDIIHLHDCLYLSNLIVFFLSRLMRKPVLLSQHVKEVPYQQAAKRLLQSAAYQSAGRWLLSEAEQVVFFSVTVHEWFSRFVRFHRPPKFIANGVDVELFQPVDLSERQALRQKLNLPTDCPLFLFAGRFVEKKGIRLLRSVIEDNSAWHWVLIGRPDDEDPQTWNAPNVTVLPPMPHQQLRNYYALADLMVLPSVGEGFPLSVQECMACGTPVMLCEETLAAVPGTIEICIATQPSVPAITSRLQEFVNDMGTLPELRDRVREFACREWSLAAACQQYRDLLQATLLHNKLKA